MDAVHIVRSMPHLTLAPAAVQEPIRQRIDKYLKCIFFSHSHVPQYLNVISFLITDVHLRLLLACTAAKYACQSA